ncbi:mitochondrial substrate carrier family protein [Heterostelium album PN500]|uniref:Mitochondrial substrate carrier family protein n=1 Tax=Heterostelium pallidum (strain ATCC 26659 / Pp 5 / PN500) TaxID=670386 RepID=D3BKP2_HETP5|nr:mitochondrial substrate carrier family protein [Heterostelium album PN500]EFA78472.1 mitochondrial substrate carrier family protein [Heterostelium album PN500]|eukprot:XP_020430596.1 mitochondrial substrate carrier family protein [Heterostelium album PN500]
MEKQLEGIYYKENQELVKELSNVMSFGKHFYADSLKCTSMPTLTAKKILSGSLSYPATDEEVKQLVDASVRAPHGKGTETVVDENVRKVWQMDKSSFKVAGINPILNEILPKIAQELGMAGEKIKADLYKLLIYDKGAFFLPHKDSEKVDQMFGTLVITLPCEHKGGDLVISHSGQEDTVSLENSDASTLRYCAFYADCTHEVKPVTDGNRICLVYNLLKSGKRALEGVDIGSMIKSQQIVAGVEKMVENILEKTGIMIYIMEHSYTTKTLSLGKLKGKDKPHAALFGSIAQKLQAVPCIGMVEIEETGYLYHDCAPVSLLPRTQGLLEKNSDVMDHPKFTFRLNSITGFDGLSRNGLDIEAHSVIPYKSLSGTKPNHRAITSTTGNEGSEYERSYLRAAVILIKTKPATPKETPTPTPAATTTPTTTTPATTTTTPTAPTTTPTASTPTTTTPPSEENKESEEEQPVKKQKIEKKEDVNHINNNNNNSNNIKHEASITSITPLSTNEFSVKKQMFASIIGGMVTALVVTPLDVVKTRQQTSSTTHPFHLKSTITSFYTITKSEGVSALWRGLTPSLLMTIPSTAIYFTTYEHLKQNLSKFKKEDDDNIYLVPLVAGSLARVISASVTSPFELIRTNSQGISKTNLIPMIRDIVNNVGLTGLWRGLSPTLIRDVPFSAFYWSGYEVFKNYFNTRYNTTTATTTLNHNNNNKPSPFLINFTSGALSGSIAAILTTPIDVIKTRIQMTVQHKQVVTNAGSSTGTSHILNSTSPIEHAKSIYKQEGWVGLTKGMVPRVAKVAPACAIMVSTYEWVKSTHFEDYLGSINNKPS